MKKLFILFAISLIGLAASAQRFSVKTSSGGAITGDNTGGALDFKSAAVTLGATDSIAPSAFHHYFAFSTLTQAKSIVIKKTFAKKWDEAILLFACDTLTAGRVVTFTSNTYSPLWTTTSGGTITVKASKKAIVEFIYDGTKWCEKLRSIQY